MFKSAVTPRQEAMILLDKAVKMTEGSESGQEPSLLNQVSAYGLLVDILKKPGLLSDMDNKAARGLLGRISVSIEKSPYAEVLLDQQSYTLQSKL